MYSVNFMINIWFYFSDKWKCDINKLKEYDCNIRYRLEDLIKNLKEKTNYNHIVDGFWDKYLDDNWILGKLLEYIKFWIAILLKHKTRQSIKKEVDNWFFDTNYFDIIAKDIFGIKHEDPSKYAKIKPVITIEPYIPK